MSPDAAYFLLAVPAVLFAGVSKGGFGSGASFAATPMLALILAPGEAVGLMLPLLMLMDLAALRLYWRQWHWPSAWPLMLGALPGVLVGALVYGMADADLVRLLIGGVALAFVAFQALRAGGALAMRTRLGAGAGVVAGAVGGFTSFVSHAGGPPAAVFLLSRGLGKTAYQATSVLAFWEINLLKLLPYVSLGIIGRDTLRADLMLAPVAIAGVLLGAWMHRRMNPRLFFALTYSLLVVTGAKLIWDGLA